MLLSTGRIITVTQYKALRKALFLSMAAFCCATGGQASVGERQPLPSRPLSEQLPDSDSDGLSDIIERALGTDPWLSDTDGDGLADLLEVVNQQHPLDSDHDRMINALDIDDDNDGIPTVAESKQDTDSDGVPDYLDLDADGDGIPDHKEAGISGVDADNDGVVDEYDVDQSGGEDHNGDGIDSARVLPDRDGDGIADVRDVLDDGVAGDLDQDGLSNQLERQLGTDPLSPDSDSDGVPDTLEIGTGAVPLDTDSDGRPDILDSDDDNDGVLTQQEVPSLPVPPYLLDTDADGVPNYLDTDDDGDGIASRDEDTNRNGLLPDDDTDFDGIANYLDYDDSDGADADRDNDGLTDWQELALGSNPAGTDTDGDGVSDELEIGLYESAPADTDNDGVFDFLDQDDDGDGIPTALEGEGDRDGDGRVNYLDVDSGGYFYCVSDGRIVEGVRDFRVVPAAGVAISADVASGRFRWQASQPGTYRLQFSLPAGMSVANPPHPDALSVDVSGERIVSLGRGEDILRPGYLVAVKRKHPSNWYQQFVIQDVSVVVINLNIPLQGGACDNKRDRVTVNVGGSASQLIKPSHSGAGVPSTNKSSPAN